MLAVFAIVLATILALFGALGRLSRNPIAYGVSGLLHLVLPGHAAHRAAVPDLPGPARRSGRTSRALLAADVLTLDAASSGRRHRPGAELRGVHDRDLPRRHPVGRARPSRGRRRARDDVPAADAAGGPAAGVPGHHPADRQRVHRDDEGHGARERSSGVVVDRPSSSAGRSSSGSSDFTEPRGAARRRGALLGADGDLHVLPARLERRIGKGYVRTAAQTPPARKRPTAGARRRGGRGRRYQPAAAGDGRRSSCRADDETVRDGERGRPGRGPAQVLRPPRGAQGHRHGGPHAARSS